MNILGIERDVLEYLASLSVVAGAVYAAYRASRRPYRKIMSAVERMGETADAVLGTNTQKSLIDLVAEYQKRFDDQMWEQREVLEQLRQEVMPNHGSSMNDRISMMLGETRSRLDSDHLTAYFSANRHGEMVWVNRTFLKWFGCKPEDTFGHRWFGLIHPDNRDRVAEEWAYAIKAGRQTRFSHIRVQNGSGGWNNVCFDVQPIYGGTHLVIGFHGWVRFSPAQDAT